MRRRGPRLTTPYLIISRSTWGKVSTQLGTKGVSMPRVCFPLFLSPSRRPVINISMNKCSVNGGGGPNSKRRNAVFTSARIVHQSVVISAHFPPFSRGAGPCRVRPPARRRDNRRRSPSAVVARRSDARIGASRRISCIRARAAGVLDSYRDARGCSSLRPLAWVDTCHETGSTSGVHERSSRWPVTSSCFFHFITFGIEMK